MVRRDAIGTTVKLLIACLIVGLILSWLDVEPSGILDWMFGAAQTAARMAADFVGWAGSYIILGACLVLPVWLVMTVVRVLRKR